MKRYTVQITHKALSDMEEIYNYIAEQLQAQENAMRQYNRIADGIQKLEVFPERVKIMEYRLGGNIGDTSQLMSFLSLTESDF